MCSTHTAHFFSIFPTDLEAHSEKVVTPLTWFNLEPVDEQKETGPGTPRETG